MRQKQKADQHPYALSVNATGDGIRRGRLGAGKTDEREAAVVHFPGGYIAEIHSVIKK